jgi:hypothetical protein
MFRRACTNRRKIATREMPLQPFKQTNVEPLNIRAQSLSIPIEIDHFLV